MDKVRKADEHTATAGTVNDYLKKYCERSRKWSFINNTPIFDPSRKGHWKNDHYCDRDSGGIHVSQKGAAELHKQMLGFFSGMDMAFTRPKPSKRRARSNASTPPSDERQQNKKQAFSNT